MNYKHLLDEKTIQQHYNTLKEIYPKLHPYVRMDKARLRTIFKIVAVIEKIEVFSIDRYFDKQRRIIAGINGYNQIPASQPTLLTRLEQLKNEYNRNMDYLNTSLMTEEEGKEYNSVNDLVTMMEESIQDNDMNITPKRLLRPIPE